MRIPMLGAALLVTGCAQNSLDEAAAQDTFRSMITVMTDVQLQVYDAVQASDAAKDLSISSDDGALAFSGDLDGGSGWDGTIDVDGDVSFSDMALYGFDLSLDAETVDVSGLVLDGWIEWAADGDVANDVYTYSAETFGELAVSGSAEGEASFNYTIDLTIDAELGAYSYEADGEVSGYDISDWESLLSGSGIFSVD